MKLEAYLKAIRECPDEIVEIKDKYSQEGKTKTHKLTAELGIYDNWPIFLDGNWQDLEKMLRETEKFGDAESLFKNKCFGYLPGTITIYHLTQFKGFLHKQGYRLNEEDKKHFERQKKYNLALVVQPYQQKRIEGYYQKVMGDVIIELSNIFVKNNISFCFPHSIGWKNSGDLSRIVYYPDEDEEQALNN